MRKLFTTTMLLVVGLGLAVFGCSKKATSPEEAVDDNAAITTLLNTSGYTTTDNYGDDGTAAFAKDAKSDTFPNYMRWRRRITGITRNISVAYDSGGLFATATITTNFTGRFVVDNTDNGQLDTFSRAINDQGVRHVWLKKWNNRWHFWGASPLEIWTDGAATGVIIDSVVVHATAGENPDVTFLGQTYGQTLHREHMPIFAPGATVTATVHARTSTGADSAWAFLHRRIFRWQAGPNHIREPFYRESQMVFSRSWTLASDSILAFPAVRHACVDVLLGSTLFGDNTAEYSARLWTMPYIVKAVSDTMP